MKILHITQNYYPSVGGTQHTIKKLSEYFCSNYHDEVTVITSNSLYGPNRQQFVKVEKKEEVINGVQVKRFPFLKTPARLLRFVAKMAYRVFKMSVPEFFVTMQSGPISPSMKKAINQTGADVICASSVHYLFADYPLWRKHLRNPKPFVMYGALHLHDTHVLKQYYKRIEAADYYIANTPYEKDYLVKGGIDPEKIKVIGTATDILTKADFSVTDKALKKQYNIAEKDVVITYIGRHEALKGITVLLDAFNLLTPVFKNILLFICGAAGSYTSQLNSIAAANSRIRILTNVTDLQKTQVLRLTDALVLPSKEESFGVVFLEAWSFNKAVIGTDIGAVASLIDDGKDGLIFKADDAQSLAEKLTALIQDELLRSNLGNNGNVKLQENYTWDIVAKKYRHVYQLAINKFNLQQQGHL